MPGGIAPPGPLLYSFFPIMAGSWTILDRETQEARLEAFLRLIPMSIIATWLISLGLFILYRSRGAPFLGLAWILATTLVSLAWLLMVGRDRRPKDGPGRRILGWHILAAALLAAVFGQAPVHLFPLLEGHEELLVTVAFMAVITSGAFVSTMVPSIALTWVATLGACAMVAILSDRDGLVLPTLGGFLVLLAYLVYVALAYYRLYRERFSFQLEAERRKQELETFFEQSPLSIVMTDLSGQIVQTNQKMEELSGYSKEELIGANPRVLKSGKTPGAMYVDLWSIISRGENWTGEFVNRDKSGREYIEKASISPIKDAKGSIQRFMAIKEDVTLQREVEAKLRDQNEIIELLLRDFEEQSSDWLWELDGDLRISYVSKKMSTTSKGTSILGMKALDFLRGRLPPEDAEAEDLLVELLAAVDKGRPFKDLEAKIMIGASLHWLAFTATPKAPGKDGRRGWRGVGRDITGKKLLELALFQRANFDEATGLASRYRFQSLLDESLKAAPESQQGILGIMRLGRLDILRADLGSRTCNRIIADFLEGFREAVGKDIALARLDRDEFAFWATSPDVWLLERIHAFSHRMNDTPREGSEAPQLELCIGLAFYPEDARDRSNLFHAADLALNSAKASPERRVMRYQMDLAAAFARRLTLLNEFPSALAKGQLHMVYQAQVDAATRRIVGAEALMRWVHPRLGPVSPGEFIPLAEQGGFITALGEWSLHQVCRDAKEWARDISVSVNVSGVQLRDPRRLSQAVAEALSGSGLPAQKLVLEITESAMFGGQDALVGSSLSEFRRLGIAIALDDFGTGYSSLAYLQRLHLDKLKIDQSFVKGLDSDQDSGKIIATIIELASTMGFQTVAEGVELESQAAFLQEAGCHWFQGWLFGKPLDNEAFKDLLAQDGA